jgi:hypothetical protein
LAEGSTPGVVVGVGFGASVDGGRPGGAARPSGDGERSQLATRIRHRKKRMAWMI